MALVASTLDAMTPLPLAPGGSLRVAEGVAFVEDDEGSGSVFLWGMAAWSWGADDRVARRLAAVQLVESKAARQRQVAAAFGVCEDTVIIWRAEYKTNGTAGLAGRPMGPKGPSKLTDAKRDEIRELRAEGLGLLAVAARAGVSTDTVRRALVAAPTSVPVEPAVEVGLEPLARPADRSAERQAARAGAITEAPPVICEGASLPLAGALLVLPALAATGLLEAASSVYTTGRAAFYGLRSLVMAVVFAAVVGEPRAEGLTRIDPIDAGRLLGLDRAPEVTTMRRRMEALAALGRADRLIDTLARRHLDTHATAAGIFYVDGHVRAYHGGAEVPKAHVARIRLAMRAEVDTWVCDRNGDGLLVWATPPGASLTGELRAVVAKIRALVGPDARPTICFDRGGWSPKLFAELTLAGFDILTYRKGPAPNEPRSAFVAHTFTDDAGRAHEYRLADRTVRIPYDAGQRRFACRQITRLDPASGHQTQILTTRADPDPAPLAHAMFNRWSQENFFRYMRAHYGLDALDTYATIGDDTARMTPNPARRHADRMLPRRTTPARRMRSGRRQSLGRRPTPKQRTPRRLRRRPHPGRGTGGRSQSHPRQAPPRPGSPRRRSPRPRTQTHPRRHPHGHLQRRVRPRPHPRPPLRPRPRRSAQPATRSVPHPRRPRSRRRPAPCAPLPPISAPTDPCHRRALRRAHRHQDPLPRDETHPRLLGQGGPMTPQR